MATITSATPVASNGIPGLSTSASTASSTTTGSTAARTATTYSSTPAASTGTNSVNTQAALTNIINEPNAQFRQDAAPIISGATSDAVATLTAFAQSKMDQVQSNINALMQSEGGEMNAAKLQVYSTQLQNYTTIMEMASKMQEKKDRAVEIWVRP